MTIEVGQVYTYTRHSRQVVLKVGRDRLDSDEVFMATIIYPGELPIFWHATAEEIAQHLADVAATLID